MNMQNVCGDMCGKWNKQTDLVARVLIALIFFMGGVGKLSNPAGTVQFMADAGIPMAGPLMWVAAIFLIVASILLVVGYKKCMVAGLLALYTILVTIIFHLDFSDQTQLTFFLKNLAIIGGLLLIMNSCGRSCMVKMKKHGNHEHPTDQ